jgi:hypothetical protein
MVVQDHRARLVISAHFPGKVNRQKQHLFYESGFGLSPTWSIAAGASTTLPQTSASETVR